nr:LPS export ABC transporter permease LptF [Oceanicola granulosus]
MGRFDRYLLGQLMTLFGFFSLVLILLYWVNRAVVLFDQLISDGQSALVFLEFSALSLPAIIRIVLPLAAFIAALYVTNKLTTESELLVVQSTGFSPVRLARPAFVFGLIVTLLTGALTHVLVPVAAAQLGARQDEIASNITARFLTPGQFLNPVDGITVYVRDINDAGALQDLFLADTRESGRQVIYTAATAYLVRSEGGPQLVMVDGLAQTLRGSDQRLYTTRFDDFTYDIGRLIVSEEPGRLRERNVWSGPLLQASPALQAQIERPAVALRAEVHDRMNKALLGFVGPVLGFAALLIGGFSRFGVWRQIVVAVVLVVVVTSLESVSSTLVDADPTRWPLLYMPTLVGLAIASALFWLAAHPALLRRRPAPPPPEPAGGAA